MSKRNFRELIENKWSEKKFVCVGLDSDSAKIPRTMYEGQDYFHWYEPIISFNKKIIDVTKDIACAYKINSAFYAAHGEQGFLVLDETIKHINTAVPDVPVIYDAKRADIGNTNVRYAQMAFEYLKADAITVHPYLGEEALIPFLERRDKGIFVLCRTSNLGAAEFQDLKIKPSLKEAKKFGLAWDSSDRNPEPCWVVTKIPLYQYIAYRVAKNWNKNNNCGLVVGATCPEELHEVRKIVGDIPILIPGIGAQGGDIEKTVLAGKDSRGKGMIINASRSIIFASSGPDFAEAARRETLKLHNLISQYR